MRKLLALLLSLSILNIPVFGYSMNDIYEPFNELPTNAVNFDAFTKHGNRIAVVQDGESNKSLYIKTMQKYQGISFATSLTGKYYVYFEARGDAAYNGKLVLGAGSTKRNIISLANGKINTHNGKVLSSGERICVALDQLSNTYSVYVNGKCVLSDNYIGGYKLITVTTVSIEFASSTEAGVYLDNVYIGAGEYVPSKKLNTVACNSEVLDEVSFDMPQLSNTIYFYEPFDADKSSKGHFYNKDNILEKTESDTDGGICMFKRVGVQDAHLDIDDVSVTGDETYGLVYQADVKMANSASSVLLTLKDRYDEYFDYALIKPNGILTSGDYSVKIPINKWNTIALCYNMYNSTYVIYVNGKPVMPEQIYEGEYNHDNGYIWRMHAQGNGADDCYYLDNLAIYGGLTVRDSLEEATTVQTEFTDKFNILRSEDTPRAYMDGKIGYHTRSGVVYVNGEKSFADSIDYNDTCYVAIDFFNKAFPSRISVNGEAVSVDGKTVGVEPAVKNGIVYLPIRSICENYLNKYVTYDGTTVDGGMIIISDNPITLPDDTKPISSEHDDTTGAYMMHCSDLQNLNDFLFFRRPEVSTIKADYAFSKLAGVHPRILLDDSDFTKLRANVKTNSRMANWYSGIIAEADKLIKQDTLIYELRDGVRLWYVSNDFVSRMMILGIAYQLTGEKKYATRGTKEMLAIAQFPGWHPEHHIDVGAMGIGYAIGYDWLYSTFDNETRTYLEKRAYDNFYTEYIKGFTGLSCDMADGISFNNNHNAVMNGGSVIMANAFMDVYPDASSYLIAGSTRATENMLYNFAPLGNWYEGVAYGTMTLRFLAYQMASMDKIYNTLYTLDKAEGLSQAAEYCIYMQGPAGPYSFSDATSNGASRNVVLEPSMLWFASYYNTPSVQTTWFKIFHYMGTGDSLARLVMWYQPEYQNSRATLDVDKIYQSINVEVMRNSWMPMGQTMVGIKGGKANVEHGHMDAGSFGFASGNTRWIDDIGADDYDLLEFFHGFTQNDRRWTYYRERAEAHSCIVVGPNATDGGEYDPNATAVLTPMQNKPRGATAQIDMTTVIGTNKVASARRGFFFTDDRQSLVVRDELDLKTTQDVYWLAWTGENARIDGNSIVLSSISESGKTLRIDFACDKPFTLSVDEPEPLPETKSIVQSFGNSGKRLTFKTNARGKLNITAKLTLSDTLNPSLVVDYDNSIDSWNVPDGSIKIKPYIDILKAGDIELSTSAEVQNVLIDEDEAPAMLSAVSDDFDISIQQAHTVGDYATVTVTDRQDSSNYSVYKVHFTTLTPTGVTNIKEYTIKNLVASDEPQSDNCASNVLDRSLDTRWSADGAQSLTLDLGKPQSIDRVIMAFMDGNSRKYNITICVSNNDVDYDIVFDGTSSGKSNDYEVFTITPSTARYVKIIGNGHDSGTWDSWTEVAVGKAIN